MATSNTKVTFKCDIQKVWDIVTDLDNYAWRSDLGKIEVINEHKFIEYTKDGYQTKFTTIKKEPCARWEFDIENDNIKGHWTGLFIQKGDETVVDFTEEITAKKVIMKPFVKAFLKKQQVQYISDLKKELII